MSDETTAPGAGAPPASRSDGAEIGRHLSDIVEKMIIEHLNWATGFHNWVTQMLMNMQPIPPQAYVDVANRERWLKEYLAQFDPVAAILKESGHGDFAALLAEHQERLGQIFATRHETSAAITADAAATQRELMNIQSKMSADNMQATAARLKLQNETAAFIQEQRAAGIAAQQESNRRMNETVNRGLFGS